jgi:cytochrome P450
MTDQPSFQPSWLQFNPATRQVKLAVDNDAFVQNPYEVYSEFHTFGGRVFWEDYGFWCFANFDDVNGLLRDKRFGREVPAANRAEPRQHLSNFDRVERFSLLELEPPDHTRLRKLVNRAFVSSQIERLRPEIETLCNSLIDGFDGQTEVELIKAYATPIPLRVISSLMGVPQSLEPMMLEWSHAMVKLYTLKATLAQEQTADAACRDFHSALSDLIAHKKRHPAGDLLSELANRELSIDEIVSTAVLLMNAGHEATVHQTGNALGVLLHPNFPERRSMITEFGSESVVEEALRFDAPLHLFTRYANEDVDFGDGVIVKKDEQIGLLLGAANRDPNAFSNAQEFQPRRSDQKNVSFGAGIHFCLGAPLARMEMAISLRVLLDRLPQLSLAAQPRFGQTYHFHGLETLSAMPRG